MARKTLRKIAGILAAAGAVTPVFSATVVGADKTLKFAGHVSISGTVYDVATNAGKVKSYVDVDGFVRDIAANLPNSSGTYQVSVETGLMLVSNPPSDVKKDAAAKELKFTGVKTAQQAVVAGLDTQLGLMAGWATGNALQVAKYNEVVAQKAAVNEDIVQLDAMIAAYHTIAIS